MPQKTALITGVNGQDGSYLAELLLKKGYRVTGTVRRASTFNRWRLDPIYRNLTDRHGDMQLVYADLNDASSLVHALKKSMPDEIYNIGAQSHVGISFETPEYTAESDALGVLRLLESMRALGLDKTARFYQASTSELFGMAEEIPQRETTPFHPRSPYGVAKLYAYWIVKNYREAYGLYGVNGILFNHESPRRGENFVTKKITRSIARIKLGTLNTLFLGNLEAKRDWGYAKEYVEAMWLMLQQPAPDDFVIATGEAHTVREFVEETCRCVDMDLAWTGEGANERGVDRKTGKTIVAIDPRYTRPSEVDILQGDITKAKKILGWSPKVTFKELVKLMVEHDLKQVAQESPIFID